MHPFEDGLGKQAQELIGIRRRLEAPNPWARCDAVYQLSAYPWEATEHIFQSLVENDRHWGVGLAIVNALAHYPREHSDLLLKKLHKDHWDMGVQERALEILHDHSRAKTNGVAHPHVKVFTNKELKEKMAELAIITSIAAGIRANGKVKIAGTNGNGAGGLHLNGSNGGIGKKVAAIV